MFKMIIDFFLSKNNKHSCYTYIGKNREFKNRKTCIQRTNINNVKIKKLSTLSKYFEDAKSLFSDEYFTIV